MKRSDFANIVNEVDAEERNRLKEILTESPDPNGNVDLVESFLKLASEIPTVAARAAAEIITRSGLLQIDDD